MTEFKTPIVLGTNGDRHEPLNPSQGQAIIPASIPISPDGGNLLENRGNGLYYGMQAPPDIANLYISTSLGNDNNSGTKDAPLRTLDRLSDILSNRNPSGNINVWLRAGETFQGTKVLYMGNGTLTLNFYYYDDPIFGDAYSLGVYRPWLDKRLNRPKIVYDTFYDTTNKIIQGASFVGVSQSAINYEGIDIVINDSLGKGTSSGAWFIYNYRSDFRGGKITMNSNTLGYGSSTQILFRQVIIEINGLDTIPDKKLFISDNNPILFYQNYGKDEDVIKDPNGERPDIICHGTNVLEKLKPQNIMATAEYDATTKSQFGYTTSWDPFKDYTGM